MRGGLSSSWLRERRLEGRTKVLIRLEEEEVNKVVPSADLLRWFVSKLCCSNLWWRE